MSITDALARELAQTEFSRPLLLEAGAGTGKTATLVNRLLSWCLQTGWVENARAIAPAEPPAVAARTLRRIAALTFTEAAAREMELRFLEGLELVARERRPVGFLPLQLSSSTTLGRRAKFCIEAAHHLQVRTLHSFCLAILAHHPLEASLPPCFVIDADGSRTITVCDEILAAEIAMADGAIPKHLAGLLARGVDPRRLSITVATLAVGGADLPPLDLDLHPLIVRGHRICQDLGSLLTRSRLRPAARNARAIETALARLRPRLMAASKDHHIDHSELVRWFDDTLSTLLRNHLGLWSRQDLSSREEQRALRPVVTELRELSAALVRFIDHLHDIDLERLAQIHAATRHYLDAVRRNQRELGIVGFQDLAIMALRLLRSNSRIADHWRRSIDQILVDELQDTDRTQVEILALLALSGNASDEGRGLFAVGDPKQSVYGWRNADLEAYEALGKTIVRMGGKKLYLTANFRSRAEILSLVDSAIGPLMKARAGIQPAFVALEAASETKGELSLPAIEEWLPWTPGKSGRPVSPSSLETTRFEARSIAADLARLASSSSLQWSEVAILSRTGRELGVYADALRSSKIPCSAVDDGGYYGRREIIDASCLARTILAPEDRLALVTFLRSPLVGVPDAAWVSLSRVGIFELFEGQRSMNGENLRSKIASIPTRLQKALPRLRGISGWSESLVHAAEAIFGLRRTWREGSIEDFITEMRNFFPIDLLSASAGPDALALANIDRFFHELGSLLETSGADLRSALASLRRWSRPRPDRARSTLAQTDSGAVRLLTVHAAKGLEFSHVYIVQMDRRAARDSSRDSRIEQAFGRSVYRLFGCPSPGFDSWQSQRALEEEAELIRTFYVAMTRAKDRLVLLRRFGPRASDSQFPKAPHSYEDLLISTSRSEPTLEQLCQQWNESIAIREYSGVSWFFPSLEQASEATIASPPTLLPDVETLLESEVSEWQRDATERMLAIPFFAASGHTRRLEENAAQGDPVEPIRAADPAARQHDDPGTARLVGATLHDWLETLELDQPIEAQFEVLPQLLDCHVRRAGLHQHGEEAHRRLSDLVPRIGAGRLLRRLIDLGPHIAARELPVVLASASPQSRAERTALGYSRGIIDLVYHDHETGSPVVVDFKTDWILRPGGDERDATGFPRLIEHSRRYRDQAIMYATSLQHALELDDLPRVELWFFVADHIVSMFAFEESPSSDLHSMSLLV